MSPCGQGRAGTSRGPSVGFAARPPHAGPQRGHSVCCVTCGQATVLSLPQFPQYATEVMGVPVQRLLGAGPRGRGPARVPPPRICCCSWAQACWPWVPLPTSPFLCIMVPRVRALSPDPRTILAHTVPVEALFTGDSVPWCLRPPAARWPQLGHQRPILGTLGCSFSCSKVTPECVVIKSDGGSPHSKPMSEMPRSPVWPNRPLSTCSAWSGKAEKMVPSPFPKVAQRPW